MSPSVDRVTGDESWLVVGAADGDFAVPVERVLEILPVSALEMPESGVPVASAYAVCGLVIAGGHSVPVVDLSVRLGSTAVSEGTQRILLAESERRKVGIRVDRVEDLATVPRAELRPFPPYLRTAGNQFLAGMFQREGGWLMLLDIDHLMHVTPSKAGA